jgi:hypothetical protein
MATGTSSRRRTARSAAALALLAAVTASAVALADGASPRRSGAAPAAVPAPPRLLGALVPRGAPGSWPSATIPSGAATLRRPPRWAVEHGDAGTVTFALRDGAGRYLGYLNVTPRQGAERLRGWAAFRLGRNREEGDSGVRELAAREGISFPGARGSCVIDDYGSRAGEHPYREIACIVRGPRSESVLIAAALRTQWPAVEPALERAVESFIER